MFYSSNDPDLFREAIAECDRSFSFGNSLVEESGKEKESETCLFGLDVCLFGRRSSQRIGRRARS